MEYENFSRLFSPYIFCSDVRRRTPTHRSVDAMGDHQIRDQGLDLNRIRVIFPDIEEKFLHIILHCNVSSWQSTHQLNVLVMIGSRGKSSGFIQSQSVKSHINSYGHAFLNRLKHAWKYQRFLDYSKFDNGIDFRYFLYSFTIPYSRIILMFSFKYFKAYYNHISKFRMY